MSSKEKVEQDSTLDKDKMLKELQSWWEIPSIAQYISLFRESFDLPEIEIEELENALIEDATKGSSEWLEKLLLSFLQSQMPSRVSKENWEVQLQKLVTRKCEAGKEKTPFPPETPFSKLSLRAKVEIIYSLCLYRLDRTDITEVMKSMDADALRVQKLGFDDIGNTYWYFYGTRLYKEESFKKDKSWSDEWKRQKTKTFQKQPVKRRRGRPRKIKTTRKSDGESEDFEDVDAAKNDMYMNVDAKSRWSVVCDTIEEWVNFAEKFKNSKSKNEKDLFKIVQENFLPTLNNIYEEKEKKFQQKLKELMPAREKIVTRREARKLQGDVYEPPVYNGYASNDYSFQNDTVKSRAQRLEERNKRSSQAVVDEMNKYKKRRKSESNQSSSPNTAGSQSSNENYGSPENNDEKEVDLQSEIEKFMSSLKLHKDAWPFLYPVDENDAPHYYDIVKKPIDLSTIDRKLQEGVYDTVGELDQDFSLMVSNCKLYNGVNNEFYKMVQNLYSMFQKGISEILDSATPLENSNESESSSSSSDQMSQSPPARTYKKHRKEKRKTKRQSGMEALEMLAQASELAIQNSNSNDMLVDYNKHDNNKKTNDFSNLKVSSVNSHPASLIERFSSESSNDEDPEQNTGYYGNDGLEVSNNQNAHYSRTNHNQAAITVPNKPTRYMNSNVVHFIEKHSISSLNSLSNNDLNNVFADGSHQENVLHHESEPPNEQKTPDNLSQVFGQDYNENISNMFNQIMKQPTYNSVDISPVTQTIANNSSVLMKNSSKNNLPGNVRKSPQMPSSSFSPQTQTQTSPLMHNINIQTDLVSPHDNLTTVDASAIEFSSKPITSTVPIVIDQGHFAANQNGQNAVASVSLPKPSPTYQSNSPTFQPNSPIFQSNSPTVQSNSPNLQSNSPTFQQNLQLPSNELVSNQIYQVGPANTHIPVSCQSINFSFPATVANTQANFSASDNQTSFGQSVTNSESGISSQVPAAAAYSSTYQQPTVQVLPQSNLMGFSVPTTSGNIQVVSESSATGSGITYVYAQSKMDNSGMGEEGLNYVPLSQASPVVLQVSPKSNKRKTAKQVNVLSNISPQKRPRVAQQYSAKSPPATSTQQHYMPHLPTATNNVRSSLAVTSSNFIPVNSHSQSTNKPFIIRPLKQVSGSPNRSSKTIAQNNNSSRYENDNSKKVPIFYAGYNPPRTLHQNQTESEPNQNPVMVQPNLVMSNGNGIVQQVLFSPDQQPIQLSNNGQFIFASPQNGVGSSIYSGSQSHQMENSIRQVGQGFAKVVPQVISQAPVLHMPKDCLQGVQFQTVLQNGQQAYQQVPQNAQFVNIPTYLLTNQNQLQSSVPQNVMSLQQFQMAQRRQMQINGQENG